MNHSDERDYAEEAFNSQLLRDDPELERDLRTADDMLLDIRTHATKARIDWEDNAYGRRTPKGLLSMVLLESELPGPKSASWGVKA